jgi:hypothetical protein
VAEDAAAFLAAAGFSQAQRRPLAGDASVRRYERLLGGPRPALLMAAPPDQLDLRPYLRIAAWLRGQGWSAPAVLAADPAAGLVLLEDLGDDLLGRVLAAGADESALYGAAIDLLVALQRAVPPPNLPAYDDARFLTEVGLLPEWYAPQLPAAAKADYHAIWQDLLPAARFGPASFVYLDYHAENLLWLPARAGLARLGLLDFQDARLGPPAYDLASLLQDARRDVPPALARAMIQRYLTLRPELAGPAFHASYALLAAQRQCKILGLFSRLARRDGKPHYLGLLGRVRRYLGQALAAPALAPLQDWFARHLACDLAS